MSRTPRSDAPRSANVLPFRRQRGWHGPSARSRRASPRSQTGGRRGGWLSPIMVMLPLAAFTAVFAWDGGPPGAAMPFAGAGQSAGGQAVGTDRERARFGPCAGPVRIDCVVDGDTFWYGGEKIRIADINTPEVSRPDCPAEAALGARATRRLTALLNAGPFTLEPTDRATDRYGRSLRVVTRGGESLGETLVDEGLAERWRGYRGEWC